MRVWRCHQLWLSQTEGSAPGSAVEVVEAELVDFESSVGGGSVVHKVSLMH